MIELPDPVCAVQRSGFKIVAADALDAAAKDQHVIADHTEAVGDEEGREFMLIAQPLHGGKSRQMQEGEDRF